MIVQCDRVAAVHGWLTTGCLLSQLVRSIELEGWPDSGFDDLVAPCQIGLDGDEKVQPGRNYWDDMGRGDATQVHTELHL